MSKPAVLFVCVHTAGRSEPDKQVVTLKPGLDLPARTGVRYENWPLPDPQGWTSTASARCVTTLDGRVSQLLTELDDSIEAPHLSCAHMVLPAPPMTAGTGPAAPNHEETR